MITVGDVLNMRAFDRIWLAAPCAEAAGREVVGVGTLDHEPFTGAYDLFSAGEFVFTTLGFAWRRSRPPAGCLCSSTRGATWSASSPTS